MLFDRPALAQFCRPRLHACHSLRTRYVASGMLASRIYITENSRASVLVPFTKNKLWPNFPSPSMEGGGRAACTQPLDSKVQCKYPRESIKAENIYRMSKYLRPRGNINVHAIYQIDMDELDYRSEPELPRTWLKLVHIFKLGQMQNLFSSLSQHLFPSSGS